MAIRSLASRGLLLGTLLSPLTAFPATGSLLEQFEKDATTPRDSGDSYSHPVRNKHKEREESDDSEDDLAYDLAQELVQDLASSITDLLFQMVSAPGVYSWQRVAPPTADPDPEEYPATPRREGEGLISFARVNVSYNRVSSRIYAISGWGEVGFGPFGFEARSAH